MQYIAWDVCHIYLEKYAVYPLRNMPYIPWGVYHISFDGYTLYFDKYAIYHFRGMPISLEVYDVYPLAFMPYIHLGICLKSKPILWEVCHIGLGDYARYGTQQTQVAIISTEFHYPRLYRISATSVVLRSILRIHRLMNKTKFLLRNRKMLSIWQLKV